MTTIAQSHVATVPVQIFVRHNFCGRTKSRALFSGIICNQPLCIIIVLKSFKDLIFVDDKLPAKTVKIMSLDISTYRI